MTKQEIAKALALIDWVSVQCDDIHEFANLEQIGYELMKLTQKESIQLLLEVLEASELVKKFPDTSPFKDMAEFRYVNQINDTDSWVGRPPYS